MSKPLNGIKIIDFTHVQAGPACTQMLAWFGADVIKVERPGSGDVTRAQLRDIPDADALYFTMLNSNKRSLTLDTKKPEGKIILEKMIRESDVMVENFGPGALDRMGFSWERIQELNPKMILASVKGFSEGHHYEDLKVYENVAQCAGGAASTTGWWDGPPTVSSAALGDSNTGMHLAIGILTAIIGRQQTGKGQKVAASMQDSVLNLCRVKMRDQLRLDKVGYLEEYPQYPHGTFSDVVPRGGNAGGGGQPGWVLKCKGWETDPNAYIYFTVQGHAWEPICDAIGKPEWKNDPNYTKSGLCDDRLPGSAGNYKCASSHRDSQCQPGFCAAPHTSPPLRAACVRATASAKFATPSPYSSAANARPDSEQSSPKEYATPALRSPSY